MKPLLDSFRMIVLQSPSSMFRDKYMENGLKPIEAFHSDIANNLVRWANQGPTVYYETADYWYEFKLQQNDRLVTMRRFDSKNNETSSWANLSSMDGMGKKWLINKMDKRVAAC